MSDSPVLTRVVVIGYCLVLTAIGLAMLGGGAYLFSIGGSAYYAICGFALLISAWLLLARRRSGLTLVGVTIAGTLVWSLVESGLNGWALVPRVGLFLMLAAAWWIPGMFSGLRPAVSVGMVRGLRLLVVPMLVFGTIAGLLSLIVLDGRIRRGEKAQVPVSALAGLKGDWDSYGGRRGLHHLASDHINTSNVGRLERAWTFRFGSFSPAGRPSLQTSPIQIGETLYACSPYSDVVALDALSGEQKWRFDAGVVPTNVYRSTCRGVAFQRTAEIGACAARIFAGTVDGRLVALDAKTGEPCGDFGIEGQVDLRRGMGKVIPGYYGITSAPAAIDGRIIVGGSVFDNQSVDEPSGVIRAFDARTGDLVWAWDLGKTHVGSDENGIFTRGSPNSWAPATADPDLGLVYLPMGNATPDYYGGHRSAAAEKYSSSIVAIRAATGEVAWSFQTVHHDLWDYDLAAQAALVDIRRDGRIVHALVQPTKRGEIFILDRETGEPVFPVAERAVPQDHVDEDRLSATQPFSPGLPNFGGPQLDEARMWGLTPIDQLWCRIQFRKARYEGIFTPVGVEPTLMAPSNLGGINWGGVSIDPARQMMFVNANYMANYAHLIPRAEADRMGIDAIRDMSEGLHAGRSPQAGTPYAIESAPFLSPLGVPCQQPPFGILAAIDLMTGKMVWEQPFGRTDESGPLGLKMGIGLPMGVPNIGGSITTSGGLLFIASSQDGYFRAYDSATGRELWKDKLPAGGQATPMAYVDPRTGEEFFVIAAGGSSGFGTKPGDYIVAYRLR